MALPPLEYLLQASQMSLQELELASLNRAANLGKVLRHEMELWVENSAMAIVARWFLEHREEILNGELGPQIGPKSVDLFSSDRKKSA